MRSSPLTGALDGAHWTLGQLRTVPCCQDDECGRAGSAGEQARNAFSRRHGRSNFYAPLPREVTAISGPGRLKALLVALALLAGVPNLAQADPARGTDSWSKVTTLDLGHGVTVDIPTAWRAASAPSPVGGLFVWDATGSLLPNPPSGAVQVGVRLFTGAPTDLPAALKAGRARFEGFKRVVGWSPTPRALTPPTADSPRIILRDHLFRTTPSGFATVFIATIVHDSRVFMYTMDVTHLDEHFAIDDNLRLEDVFAQVVEHLHLPAPPTVAPAPVAPPPPTELPAKLSARETKALLPFRLTGWSPNRWVLSLPTGRLPVNRAVQALEHEPNGVFWEGVAKWFLRASPPQARKANAFDSEAGQFSAISSNCEALLALAKQMKPCTQRAATVRSVVKGAEHGGIVFDD